MAKVKLCGMSRMTDIEAVNEILPDYIGFIFVPSRRRYIAPERAAELKRHLDPHVTAVGVFIDEQPERVAELLAQGVIDMAQLHGHEDEAYLRRLRKMTDRPLIKAFRIDTAEDMKRAGESTADYVLLDSGAGGTGTVFDWALAESSGFPCRGEERPYFLAGGLTPENVRSAVERFRPYAVDVSSGIETGGVKDREKMAAFVRQARSAG